MFLLGIIGLVAGIGGLVGFCSLFSSKPNYERQFRGMEAELRQLKRRVELLEAPQHAAALTQATALEVAQPSINIETKIDAMPMREVTPALVVELGEQSDSLPAVAPHNVLAQEAIASVEAPLTDNAQTAGVLTPSLNTTPMPTPNKVVISDIPAQNTAAPAQKAVTSTKPTPAPYRYTPKPHAPNILEKGFTFAKNWLFGGNTLVRAGIVILFIGVSFLLKYAAEHTHVSIEYRLAGVALSGAALLALGWRLRIKRPEYSWAIQGGGIGVMYLTIFAALKLYQLITPNWALVLLIAVVLLSTIVAVLQSAMSLAVLGFAGGFIAPILTSTGQGSHVSLFSFYLVLNLGIVLTAFYKSWRPLNVLGFAFTFVIASIWGARSYVPEFFSSTEPFLIIHYLLFTLIAVLYAYKQAPKVRDYVDSTLVFGTPIVGFGLQYALLQDSEFGMAYSALGLGIFYVALAWWVLTRKRETLQFLGECFVALGIGFATLAIPLALDGRWTSAAWAVEGVALLWAGLRQQRNLPFWTGLALQLLGGIAFFNGWGLTGHADASNQNQWLGLLMIALSGWACGGLLNYFEAHKNRVLDILLVAWGWLWWVGGGLQLIDTYLPHTASLQLHYGILFIAMTSVLLPVISKKMSWATIASPSQLLLPLMVAAGLAEITQVHPLASMGWLTWGLSFIAYGWLLVKQTFTEGAVMRAPAIWLAALLGSLEWHFQFGQHFPAASAWSAIFSVVVPSIVLLGLVVWQGKFASMTKLINQRAWVVFAGAPLIALLAIRFLYNVFFNQGNSAPLPYITLFNPLDVALLGIIFVLAIWKRTIVRHQLSGSLTLWLNNITLPTILGMSFLMLNSALVRENFHHLGMDFSWVTLFSYTSACWTAMSWSLFGLISMLLGLRLRHNFAIQVGLLLPVATAFMFVLSWFFHADSVNTPAAMSIALAITAIAVWATAAIHRHQSNRDRSMDANLLFGGWVWWLAAGLTAANDFLPAQYLVHLGLGFIALTSLVVPYISQRLKWPDFAKLSLLLAPALAVATGMALIHANIPPSADYGWLAWLITFSSYAYLLRKNHLSQSAIVRAPMPWMLSILGVIELNYWLGTYLAEASVWREVATVIAPILVLGATVLYWNRNTRQHRQIIASGDLTSHARAWLWLGSLPLVISLVAWFVIATFNFNGNPAPLPYIPLFNPLDLTLAAILLVATLWGKSVLKHGAAGRFASLLTTASLPVLGFLGFLLINGSLMRSLHYWIGTPYQWVEILHNSVLQMSFTFLWGITAFVLMLLAHQLVRRSLWVAGAALMGLVVLKLFLLDLAGHGSVERILSFIGAGIMLLVMGYFAPLPPATSKSTEHDKRGD